MFIEILNWMTKTFTFGIDNNGFCQLHAYKNYGGQIERYILCNSFMDV